MYTWTRERLSICRQFSISNRHVFCLWCVLCITVYVNWSAQHFKLWFVAPRISSRLWFISSMQMHIPQERSVLLRLKRKKWIRVCHQIKGSLTPNILLRSNIEYSLYDGRKRKQNFFSIVDSIYTPTLKRRRPKYNYEKWITSIDIFWLPNGGHITDIFRAVIGHQNAKILEYKPLAGLLCFYISYLFLFANRCLIDDKWQKKVQFHTVVNQVASKENENEEKEKKTGSAITMGILAVFVCCL